MNNRIVPLDHLLKSGDIGDILTSKNAKPSRNWLSFTKTNLARSKIRQSLHIRQEHEQKRQEPEDDVAAEEKIETIRGMKRTSLKFSKCCNPRSGDRIRAFRTKDGKITIHKEGCLNIHAMDPSREMSIRWEAEQKPTMYRLLIEAKDCPGVLSELLKVVTDKINSIHSVHTSVRKDRINVQIDMQLEHDSSLEEISRELRMIDIVLDVKHKKISGK